MKYFVYEIFCVRGDESRCYIGVTTNFQRRWIQHRSAAHRRSKTNPLYQSMRDLGCGAFDIRIIATVGNKDQAFNIESEVIAKRGKDALFNLADGGEIPRGFSVSEQRRQQHSRTMKSKFQDPEFAARHARLHGEILKRARPEFEQRRIETFRSDSHREKARAKSLQQFSDPSQRLKASLAKQTRVYHTPKGQFHSSAVAAKAHCVTHATVINRCKNQNGKFDDWYMTQLKATGNG